jgi:hypothetical protein
LSIIRSACFTSKRSVSPDAEVNTGTSAGSVESSKSPLSCVNDKFFRINTPEKKPSYVTSSALHKLYMLKIVVLEKRGKHFNSTTVTRIQHEIAT